MSRLLRTVCCLFVAICLASAAEDLHDFSVLRDGLANSRARFAAGTGRVAFLGGSITDMPGWKDQVQRDLARRFPTTRFDMIVVGIPSLGSTPHAFRFTRDALRTGPVDLLFVEAAVNDAVNGASDVEQVRGMEGIVRQARLGNPMIDIVLLHFADPDKLREIHAGKRPAVIVNHERVAERYGVPSIDLAHEVSARIDAGEFTWEKDFRDLHPSPFGHALYARAVARLLDAAWTSGTPAPHPLPEPLDPFSYFRGRLLPPGAATDLSGFRVDPSWRPTDGAGTRGGFVDVPFLVAEQPGASCAIAFDGRGIGLFVAAGPDAGMVTFSVDGGAPVTRDLFSPWSGGLHLPWAVMLAPELPPGRHVLTLTVAPGANPASRGHAVRIAHILAN